MAVSDRQILTIVDPDISFGDGSGKIKLRQLAIENSEDEKETLAPEVYDKVTSSLGHQIPYIKINTNKVDEGDLLQFVLDVTGFIPKVRVVLRDYKQKFINMDFPKDGDVISVYIRPKLIEEQKKVRCDFDILSSNVTPGKNETDPPTFTFLGILRVPGLYSESIEGFSKDTSFNHLISVCENLGLGFASNEDGTLDEMVRLRASETPEKFINDTTESSWKDENSFFTSYIDQWYNLCFVNLNKQFSEEKEYEQFPISRSPITNFEIDEQGEEPLERGDFFLTNNPDFQGYDNYIINYGLKNESASIWMSEGYKRYCQYYDMDLNEFVSEFVDPLTTEGSENELILPKGKAGDDFYEMQEKFKYLGKQENDDDERSGNVHTNYNYAKIHNYQNNREIKKMQLSVELDSTNFNLYRYQRIPLDVYSKHNVQSQLLAKRDELTGNEGDEENNSDDNTDGFYRNEFFSGFYVLEGYSYVYNRGKKMYTKLNLVRREWPIPGESFDD